jgi:AcrR family transcriptional regulator
MPAAIPPPTRIKPGPRPRVTREDIARAALELGLDAATVKAVAAHLGMDHSSLYRHVKSRDEIIAAAADLAVAELDWRTPGGDWRGLLEKLCDALWSLYERHPGLATAFREMEVMPPAGIRCFAEAVAQLQAEGFGLEDAVLALDTLVDALTDCFTGWQRFTRPGFDGQSLADVMTARWEHAALADATHAAQIKSMVSVMRGTARDWWLKRQRLILNGIAGLKD